MLKPRIRNKELSLRPELRPRGIKRGPKVFVGMSGGVDSSVAAALLKKAKPSEFEKLTGRPIPKGFRGFEVVGVHLKCYNVDGCAVQDAEDARRAAETLGIPFYVLDFEEEYKKAVVDYMVDGYKNGITPNPDVMCNKEIKFGLFLKKALEMGADYVATGHYARLCATNVKCQMFVAKDNNKDQSYFLWTLTQEQLRHCLFPIGDYIKPEVRKLARKFGLPNAEKKDSQGICFLGKVALPNFLSRYIKPKRGSIVDPRGNVIGEHNGAHSYTIGQRHLGIKNKELRIKNKPNQEPFYIADKDVKRNLIIVAEGDDHPALYRKKINLAQVNLLNNELRIKNKALRMPVLARVRYRQPLAPALFIIHNSLFKLIFAKSQKFVAPGQSAVFYDSKGQMLGGGVIKSAR